MCANELTHTVFFSQGLTRFQDRNSSLCGQCSHVILREAYKKFQIWDNVFLYLNISIGCNLCNYY